MAVRDRNLFAWQAYVVAMSIVAALMLLGIFLQWSSNTALSKSADEAKQREQAARQELNTAKDKLDRTMAMIGQAKYTDAELEQVKGKLSGDAEWQKVEKTFDTDIDLLGKNVESQSRNYHDLATFLMQAIRERNVQNEQSSIREEALKKEVQDVTARESARADEAVKQQQSLAKELETERAKFQDERTRMTGELEKVNAALQKNNERLAKVTADAQKTKAEQDARIKELVTTVSAQAKRIQELEYQDFDSAQGKIVNVSEGGRVVWINIGSRAGLKENVRFAVLPSDTLQISQAKPKAKLVITRIVGEDLAQARVLEDQVRYPVVPGDLVYSPSWRPGRKVHFALLGLLDIDDDGVDDSEKVRNLILSNGGEIDEQLTVDGKTSGTGIDEKTTYLVVGPSGLRVEATNVDGTVSAGAKATIEKYNRMKDRAREKGAIEMSVDKLLDYLRADDDTRTIPLGIGLRASDFPARSDDKNFFKRPTGNQSQDLPRREPPQ